MSRTPRIPSQSHFNSRPSARGDRIAGSRSTPAARFQFTPLREGRRKSRSRQFRRLHISIHAPPRGATTPNAIISMVTKISIHAPPRGATPPSHGTPASPYFNSRPSARGDKPMHRVCRNPPIFQFTPLREGRQKKHRFTATIMYFNSRPSARGDLDWVLSSIKNIISIHAPPRGATGAPALQPR